MMSINHLFA